MHMYKLIIDLLNNFLNYIHIPDTPLNPDVFQGVFVKKLSNQNIIKEKRRISANNTILKSQPDTYRCHRRTGEIIFL